MSNVRDICVELLTNVEKNQAYSTVAFQNVLQKHKLDARDRGLLTELFYGTIQRKLTLDFYLKAFIEKQKKRYYIEKKKVAQLLKWNVLH